MDTFFIKFLAVVLLFLTLVLPAAASRDVNLTIQILTPGSDGDDEDDEATTTPAAPPVPTTYATIPGDDDSPIEQAHDGLVDRVVDLIDIITTPESGNELETAETGDMQDDADDLRFVWRADSSPAPRVLLIVPALYAQEVKDMVITFITLEKGALKGVIASAAYDISLYGRNGEKLTDFSRAPLTIDMQVPEYVRRQGTLGLFHLDEKKQVWTRVKEAVFADNHVMFTTSHLSMFGIFALSADASRSSALIQDKERDIFIPIESAIGSVTPFNVRMVAEALVFTLYACAMVAAILALRFAARLTVRKI